VPPRHTYDMKKELHYNISCNRQQPIETALT